MTMMTRYAIPSRGMKAPSKISVTRNAPRRGEKRRIGQLEALRTIDRAITASTELNTILDVCLDQVVTQLQVNATAVLLLHRYDQTLKHAASRGFRTDAIRRTHLRLGQGHVGQAALTRETIVVPDLRNVDDFSRAGLLEAETLVGYCAVPLHAKGEVKGVLEVFHGEPLNQETEWYAFLEALAGQVAIGVDNAQLFDDLQRSNTELKLAYETTLEGWSRTLELRDQETEGHTQRVAELTVRVARRMGISEEELIHVWRGALLHDIGKMGIPDSILLKPGSLSKEEWVEMRKHPEYAYKLLSPIAFLRPALDIPYCHREKWDGSGYPRGLREEEIPLSARIFAVIDVWDALTSDRPYRDAWPVERALEHIRTETGAHFDPQVVEVALPILKHQT